MIPYKGRMANDKIKRETVANDTIQRESVANDTIQRGKRPIGFRCSDRIRRFPVHSH